MQQISQKQLQKKNIDVSGLHQEEIELIEKLAASFKKKDEELENLAWLKLQEQTFEKDWDNKEDSIYDNWKKQYKL